MRTHDRPLADYGLLGDTRACALVASDGSVDWMCLPRFDGDPVFGRLVGGDEAGTFRMGPRDPDARVVSRCYLPGTATLETTWTTPSGRLTLGTAEQPIARDRSVAESGPEDVGTSARREWGERRLNGHQFPKE